VLKIDNTIFTKKIFYLDMIVLIFA